MSKIKYIIKRIRKMSYKSFFDTINFIHQKTGKSKIILFFDIIGCGFKYQAGYVDYRLFEMYALNRNQRKTIVTRGINNEIIHQCNDQNYIHEFSDKIEFNKKYNKYLNRDWMEITKDNFKEFKDFVNKHQEIIVKPVSESCGKGVEKIKVNNKNIKNIYEELLNSKRILVEEIAIQDKTVASLHPDSINTLRLVTLNNKLIIAFIRIGNDHNVVDNFNHGGMVAPINIATGVVDYPALSKDEHLYYEHPLTKVKIVGFKIPNWDKTVKYIETLASSVEHLKYIAWDVCAGEKGPSIIEGNESPGHDLYGLPPHRSNGVGLLPKFTSVLKK